MVIPIIILTIIPIIFGIVYVSPFNEPEMLDPEVISKEPDVNILYFILIGIWTFFLLQILLRIRKGAFKVTSRY